MDTKKPVLNDNNTYKKYTEERFSFTVDDGIIFFEIHVPYVDDQLVDDAVRIRKKLTDGKTLPIVSDFSKVISGTRDARSKLACKDSMIGTSAAAVIFRNKSQKLMYSFFKLLYNPSVQSRVFLSKEKAIQWISKFKHDAYEINK